jgi:hypothetical protein
MSKTHSNLSDALVVNNVMVGRKFTTLLDLVNTLGKVVPTVLHSNHYACITTLLVSLRLYSPTTHIPRIWSADQ